MPGPRPEFDVCRVCGYDISQRVEEYLICPECGAANNRLMPAREARAFASSKALRYVFGPLAALAAVILTLCAGGVVRTWLAVPLSFLTGFCASFVAMTLLTPRIHRRRGLALALFWSAVFSVGVNAALWGTIVLLAVLVG